MPHSPTALNVPLIGLAAILSAGCEEAVAPAPAATGGFQVSVSTVGPEFGPENGYRVSVNGGSHQFVSTNGGTLFSGFAPGTYSFQLEDVPTSCVVHGRNPLSVTLKASSTAKVDFQVTCRAMGSVRVTVVSTGIDPDLNGYAVTVLRTNTGATWGARISSNDTVSIHRVDAGDHIVMLNDVALNCETRGANSEEITVAAKSTIPVTFAVECAPATQIAYVADGSTDRTDIFIVNSNGTGATNLTEHPAAERDPAWSPDGRRLAFTSDRDGVDEVYLMNADGSGVTRLTTEGAHQAAWSPDGRKIAFTRGGQRSADIYVMNADGSNPVQITTASAADFQPAWSPDGRTIAFVSERDGNPEIYMMNSDGTNPVRLTDTRFAESGPAWSPDGRKLAFARNRCSDSDPSKCGDTVLVWKIGSPEEPRPLIAGYHPEWSPNGRIVAHTRNHSCEWYEEYYGECHPVTVDFVREDGTNHISLIHSAAQATWRP